MFPFTCDNIKNGSDQLFIPEPVIPNTVSFNITHSDCKGQGTVRFPPFLIFHSRGPKLPYVGGNSTSFPLKLQKIPIQNTT
jgi:hypothetical protein